jgi:hypothetical protein
MSREGAANPKSDAFLVKKLIFSQKKTLPKPTFIEYNKGRNRRATINLRGDHSVCRIPLGDYLK